MSDENTGTKKSSAWKAYRFPLLLLAGISIGSIIGLIWGEDATVLQPLGDIFLNLMFTVVVPMVFVSIASAVGNMMNLKRLGKILGTMVTVFIGTGMVAAILVLITVNLFPPAAGSTIELSTTEMGEPSSVAEMIVGSLTVTDFSELFSRQNMLPIIVASIGFGFCVARCGGEESAVGRLLNNLNAIIMHIVKLIMYLAPIGLGAYFASLIGELGPQLLGDYARVMAIYYPLCVIYLIVFFPIYAFLAGGAVGVKRMTQNIIGVAITAFATQSSLATLPTNMASTRRIGVPKDIYEIVLPMGATMHMDGSVISSIVKIAFLFGVFGMPFEGVGTFAMAIAVSILAAFVLSGAPGGGLVGEMLIVSLFGFPPEAFPLIVTIGFLVDPMATCLNASGDTIASMLVARVVEGKDWIKKEILPEDACEIEVKH